MGSDFLAMFRILRLIMAMICLQEINSYWGGYYTQYPLPPLQLPPNWRPGTIYRSSLQEFVYQRSQTTSHPHIPIYRGSLREFVYQRSQTTFRPIYRGSLREFVYQRSQTTKAYPNPCLPPSCFCGTLNSFLCKH